MLDNRKAVRSAKLIANGDNLLDGTNLIPVFAGAINGYGVDDKMGMV